MIFVIPSYKRPDILTNQTLNVLKRLYVSEKDIHVFVIEKEYDSYKNILEIYPNINLHSVILEPGLTIMRNYITKYFPNDTEYISLDDDISEIYSLSIDESQQIKSSKRYNLNPISSQCFHEFMDNAFEECKKNNARLFGIYPVKNAYFMKDLPSITRDLRFCVGAFWGCINDQNAIITIEEKEDFERTLYYYDKYKSIIRFNNICFATKYYKTQGGMQSIYSKEDRIVASKSSCDYLVSKYSQYCKYHRQKKTGIHEIKLY